MHAGTPANASPPRTAVTDVEPDVVERLEELLALAQAEKARGELRDSSLSSWLVRQSLASRKQLPREAPGASGTGANEGSSPDRLGAPREGIDPEPRTLPDVLATRRSAAQSTFRPSSFRPAHASDPGSVKAVHGPQSADHEGKDLQGMAMWGDGWPGQSPRGESGRYLNTTSWQGENAVRTPVRSPYRRVSSMLSPLYALRTPQRSISQNTNPFWLAESPFRQRERLFSYSPAHASVASRAGSMSDLGFWPVGGAAGAAYTSSSSSSSSERPSQQDDDHAAAYRSDLELQDNDLVEGDEEDQYLELSPDQEDDSSSAREDRSVYTPSLDGHGRQEAASRASSSDTGPLVDEEFSDEDREEAKSMYSEPEDDCYEADSHEESAYSQHSSDWSAYGSDSTDNNPSEPGEPGEDAYPPDDDYDRSDTSQSDIPEEEFDEQASQSGSEGTDQHDYSD